MVNELVERVRAAMQRQLVHAVLDNERVARQHGLLVADLHLLVPREDMRTPIQISAATVCLQVLPPSSLTGSKPPGSCAAPRPHPNVATPCSIQCRMQSCCSARSTSEQMSISTTSTDSSPRTSSTTSCGTLTPSATFTRSGSVRGLRGMAASAAACPTWGACSRARSSSSASPTLWTGTSG